MSTREFFLNSQPTPPSIRGHNSQVQKAYIVGVCNYRGGEEVLMDVGGQDATESFEVGSIGTEK
jgi:hypothetical protein